MFHIVMDHLPEDKELEVVRETTSVQDIEFSATVTGEDLTRFQRLVRKVPVSDAVLRYAVQLGRTSRPSANGDSPEAIEKWVSYGASLRGAQNMILAGKARALTRGRYHVSFDDIRALAKPVLRHRVLTNFHAESEGITTDQIIEELVSQVPDAFASGM